MKNCFNDKINFVSTNFFVVLIFLQAGFLFKKQSIACFRLFENLGIGISASVSIFQTFCFYLLKFYFKR